MWQYGRGVRSLFGEIEVYFEVVQDVFVNLTLYLVGVFWRRLVAMYMLL